ncbi:TonB-dependent siderophore receptor [Novosphingobium sp. KACC 22771]|uniref:TonB-dependent siderophore receptor n=1 Tax=Novosphingobium sp. KACC 22771 TaxID=3025670 RepID=UPI0023671DCB|nr:TonB-dependent siderophore receptor [Novosphingobium sp. KACC 22771]WDF71379.1 TonB-dependent siderophore receptor [Novosphingobium sp. KACC 22771]
MLLLIAAANVTAMTEAPQAERPLDDDIVVTGRKETPYRAEVVQVGAFRNQSLLDTPANVAVITRALLDDQGAKGLDDALRNTPGITQQSTSPTTSNNFASRGVLLNARTNYRLNGALQIINLGPIPVENKQRVELLKGVSALYYGLSTPSGIVNVVTKRATDRPVTSFYVDGDAEGSIGGGVDFGRKLGADQSIGLRLNAYGSHVETPINGVNGYRYLASGAFDWKASEKLSFKLDAEHYRRATDEPGGITLPTAVNGTITLPAIPDPHNRYAPVNAPYRTWVTNLLGRADYLLGGTWSLRAESGYASTRRQRMIANIARYNRSTGAGTITATYTPDQDYSNLYWRAELAGEANTLGIRHELLFGYARNRQVQADQNQQSYAAVAQNLYAPTPLSLASLIPTTRRLTPGSVNIDTGLYAMDQAHLGEKVLVMAGLRHVDYRTRSASSDFALRTWTPTGALVLRPTAATSLYLSYIEGLESAGTAPDGTINAGAVLPAVRSRQWEVGGRAQAGGLMLSLGWFRINRGLAYTDLSTNAYIVNGRALHQGVEASVQGNLLRQLSIALAGQYLVARQQQTGSAAQDGRLVDNAPRWSGSAFVNWHPAPLPALGLNGGVYYTGQRFTDVLNQGVLPAYATLSLGASYKLILPAGRAMTLRANADNVTDKRYWATGGSTLYVGSARTLRLSANVSF